MAIVVGRALIAVFFTIPPMSSKKRFDSVCALFVVLHDFASPEPLRLS